MNSFVPLPNRDASPAIRGFVYQVQRTIQAWLDLPDDMSLYCEAGEDIDYVRRLLDDNAPPESWDRLSEQVKHFQEPVSLRSAPVVESLANFVATRSLNPNISLSFRFFTNARSRHEREDRFPGGRSGIEAWIAIQSGHIDNTEVEATVDEIRRVLVHAAVVPANASVAKRDKYTQLRAFLDSADNDALVAKLIRPFEFSTGNEGVEDLQPTIERKLRDSELARTVGEARELYRALFAEVFHRLSRSGDKHLDGATLRRIIADGTLASVDRAVLERIQQHLSGADMQLSAIHGDVLAIRRWTETAGVALGIGGSPAGLMSGSELLSSYASRPDSPPVQPAFFVERPSLVQEALSALVQGQTRLCVRV